MQSWFDVSKEGLAKLVDGKSKVFVLHELLQNAWDTKAGVVEVHMEKVPNTPKVRLTIHDDDPDGFKNFSHAWTLFAESTKKDDPEKRGLYNMGEKMVLALCYTASIKTTTGTVEFDDKGRHEYPRRRTDKGSVFEGLIRMNQGDFEDCCEAVKKLIPPTCLTYFNGELLQWRTPMATIEAVLPTTKSDEFGVMKPTRRKTTINIFEPLPGETPSLYERGIPVVETGDKWHVDIQQRVPLNMNRDNVTPAFLKEVRTLVVNHMHHKLSKEDANSTFVNEALSDPNALPGAVEAALTLKYGEKRAIFDATDKEANMNLVSQGYTLIHGSQLTEDQWKNVKRYSTAKPSGQLAPTKKALFSPDGEDRWVKVENYSKIMHAVVEYTRIVCSKLTNDSVSVSVLSDITQSYGACYGSQGFVFNLGRLGHRFFDECLLHQPDGPEMFAATDQLNQLIIHELGHHYESNHLSERYHDKLCELGAKLTRLALTSPTLFCKDIK